jgi:lipopolysaccharide transport system permease protein
MKQANSSNAYRQATALFMAVWRYRGLISGMVWREFQSRYLNSLLGSVWSILNPIAMVFIYSVIFSKIMGARVSGVDDTLAFGLFLCSGLFTWGYFSELLSRCPNLFIDQSNLLKKVNFPRIILPIVILLSATINFIIIFGIFIIFLIVTGRFPGIAILAFIPLLVIQLAFALGLGMILGTLNVFFRDIGHFINIVLQFWFWLTPIVYPPSILPESIRDLLSLNPMTDLIGAYQQIILYGDWPRWEQFRFHIPVALVVMVLGYLIFKGLSDDIVDEL